MGLLLLLAYAALCVLAFRLLHVPVNRWSVTTAVIAGVALVGGMLAGMNYNHPFSTNGRVYFYTTPIMLTVKGPVVELAAKPNVPIKRGDPLFRVEPKPYQYVVDQKRAALAEAEQNVKQLRTSVEQADAESRRVQSQLKLAQLNHDRQAELVAKNVASRASLDTVSRNLEAARQSALGAEAVLERARLAYSSNLDGVNTTVARLHADLQAAEYDLSQTEVTAPTDGYVAQMLLRPGMMVSPGTPTMVFINDDDVVFGVAFPQTAVSRLAVGNEAEVAFDTIPGRVFPGKVVVLVNAVPEGQLQTAGTLIDADDRGKTRGNVLVRIDLDGGLKGLGLPLGATAQVAVYSDHWRPVAVVRKILLRMKSWLNYLM